MMMMMATRMTETIVLMSNTMALHVRYTCTIHIGIFLKLPSSANQNNQITGFMENLNKSAIFLNLFLNIKAAPTNSTPG